MTTHDLPTIPTTPGPWIAQGACAGTPTALFFPERGGDVLPAKAICTTCTVRNECLRYALEDPDTVGIWGGTSSLERRRIRAGLEPQRPARALPPIKHGTQGGYNVHMNRGEAACDECRQAHSAYSSASRARRRAARRAVAP